MEKKYNGYTNKPTWSIMLWINNDENNHFRKKVIDDNNYHLDNNRNILKGDNRGQYKIILSDYIRDWFGEFNIASRVSVLSCTGTTPPINDLLGYTLSIINWDEIAEHLICDYESEV